jgi:hypothetical protein
VHDAVDAVAGQCQWNGSLISIPGVLLTHPRSWSFRQVR